MAEINPAGRFFTATGPETLVLVVVAGDGSATAASVAVTVIRAPATGWATCVVVPFRSTASPVVLAPSTISETASVHHSAVGLNTGIDGGRRTSDDRPAPPWGSGRDTSLTAPGGHPSFGPPLEGIPPCRRALRR